ncbi:MAG: chloride channel protein [Planctomycetaceae bacterium]|jgi:CIC family chloride channel protein|nr:chloride channel protein [Planctomycetaceae bacterium]
MEHQRYGNKQKNSIFERLKLRFDWYCSGRILIYSVFVGLLTGLAAALFYFALQFVSDAIYSVYTTTGIVLPQPSDYTSTTGPVPGNTFDNAIRQDVFLGFVLPRYWVLMLLIPMFGGLICGFIVWTFAPEAGADCTDCVIRSFHFRGGRFRNRLPIVKSLSGLFTLGSGGSAGWEGLIMLSGGGIASSVGQMLHLSIRDRRILLLAGAAGGLGAIFQIPIGAALFVTEILYASTALEFGAIIPCLVASITGYSVFRLIHGDLRVFEITSYIGIERCDNFFVLLTFVPVIALACLLFVRIILEMRNRVFRRLTLPEFIKPAIGGLLLGVVVLIYPQVHGGGYAWLYQLINLQLPFYLVILLIVPKMLATAFTVSSGGSGGMFVPSLFIGGMIGYVLGYFAGFLFALAGLSEAAPNMSLCVCAGMSVFCAGVSKVPFAAAVITCEVVSGMEWHYTMLVPLIIMNLLAMTILSSSTSLYEEQVLTTIDSEAHFGSYSIDLLQVITVRDTFLSRDKSTSNDIMIPATATIPEIAKLIAPLPDSIFPVSDSDGRLIGILHSSDVWSEFRNRQKWDSIRAGTLMQSEINSVAPDDNLYIALRASTLLSMSEIPVVDPKQPDELVCMLHTSEIIKAYNEKLATVKWTP